MSTAPFDATAQGYDLEFTETQVGRMQRACTHAWLEAHIQAHAPRTVLELNCGTGEDAKWLAQKGLKVTATDLSLKMVEVARAKTQGLDVEVLQAGIQGIGEALKGQQFDLVWSNFGGFNCLSAHDIQVAGKAVARLLKPGGFFVAVVMGRFCAWESVYFLAKLRPRQAFRRMRSGPVQARLSDGHFQDTWYYSPAAFESMMAPALKPAVRMAVGAYLPPSYLDPFFSKRSKLLARMNHWEQAAPQRQFRAQFSDHFLVAFRRE